MENLTREKALELHRQMWTDMQKDLGDEPSTKQRFTYKRNWIKNHFPELIDRNRDENGDREIIRNNCFLCEYADEDYGYCECIIDWPGGRCEDSYDEVGDWRYMPISKLLALPEREEEEYWQ